MVERVLVVGPKDTLSMVDDLAPKGYEIIKALQSPEVQERLTAASLDIHGFTRTEFETFVNKDRARWAKVVKDAGIKAD